VGICNLLSIFLIQAFGLGAYGFVCRVKFWFVIYQFQPVAWENCFGKWDLFLYPMAIALNFWVCKEEQMVFLCTNGNEAKQGLPVIALFPFCFTWVQ
jgi:hypothetical protein